MRFKSSFGIEIHYEKIGSGHRHVMLLHGLNESHLIWQHLFNLLPKDYTYLIPDLPGNGKSEPLQKHEYSIENLARIIFEIIQHENAKQVCFVGHSLGGYIGLELISSHPKHFNGLMLMHSTSQTDSEEKTQNRIRVIEILKKNRNLYFKAVFQNLFSPNRLSEFDDKIEFLQNQSDGISTDTAIGMITAIMNRKKHHDTLKKLKTPKHFVIGMEDPVLDGSELIQEARETDSDYTILDNCGHMCFYENPELCAESIHKFIEKCFKNQSQ